ncbi:phospholipase D-like domain-containing protein [Chryseobacterium gambrini]|uniref:phospholipase D-like domain-containing protein n=1 Tax=Chryseobacterium gambrini TaxID=373672 RepID=UPI0022F1C035|nr:phospholipase D-like domain-containing protein [Chryseobacterium gambrini]WBV51982.1 phospholipase D-like domain-containing protein [Chryseobacterium gambrini]
MESLSNDHNVKAQIERIKLKDAELANELESKLRVFPRVSLAKDRVLEEAVDDAPLINHQPSFIEQERVEESIVLAHLRPVLMIRDNRIVPEFSGPDMEVWKSRLMEKQLILDSVIPSVGRIEVNNNVVYNWVGTGWLIDTDIVVTNRHVASIFCKNKEGFTFKVGFPDGFQSAKLDFLEEDQRTASMEFDVDSVLWIAENDSKEPDVAFMRVKRKLNGSPLPKPIELADEIEEGEVVVTIGYPARDPNIPDQEIVLNIFGNVYDKKRLAPGEVIKVDNFELEHDCSTLGGNSGSAVISLLTGKAVGLHFAGLYLQRNFAVPATILKDLLQKLKKGKLPRMASPELIKSNENTIHDFINLNQNSTNMLSQTPNKYIIEANIPIKITLEIGGAINSGEQQTQVNLTPAAKVGDNYEAALELARRTLLGDTERKQGIISVDKGYRFKRGWITDERVIVVEVQEKQNFPDVKASGKKLIPQEFLGVGVDVRTASLFDQLDFMGINIPQLETVPKPGVYKEPPYLKLDPITEKVKAIFHVSPDSGWPNLRDFFSRIKKNLIATIYEWDAQHISDALFQAINPDNRCLKMVTQKPGTQKAVQEMQQKLGKKFEHVWASVGSGKIVPSAYHIKVASRDGEEFWLSSGNWKDSNQADINPAAEHSTYITPIRKYNREWHVIIENEKLAKLFQNYIEWDFKEASRLPLEEAPTQPEIYLFVPETAYERELERRELAQYFEPLIIEKTLNIQPLLTPDRDSRGNRIFIDFATDLIDSAKSTIDIENQSFSLLEDNEPQYEKFFNVLLRKQNEGVNIRIIFRDPREFASGTKVEAALQKQLDRIKEFGLNTDNIKVQRKCHTKAIIIDSEIPENAAVLFGSHNLTTSGALYNRDASLIIKDSEVANYFQKIFNFDWEVVARQSVEEFIGGIRIAHPNQETPSGFRKVKLSELLAED